ncbi:MAG: chorismate-binding protein, partial [Armatimonadota bacterium]
MSDFTIISLSPERFLHVCPLTRRVHTRPIKGTRPRGKSPEEGSQNA